MYKGFLSIKKSLWVIVSKWKCKSEVEVMSHVVADRDHLIESPSFLKPKQIFIFILKHSIDTPCDSDSSVKSVPSL